MKLRRYIIRFSIILIAIYILFGFVLYFSQNSMLYYPNNQNFEDCAGFSDYEKMNHNGTRFYYKKGSEDLIVYYHGNAGSACDRNLTKDIFEKTGKSLVFVEYAGYSNDNRRPSGELILNDVQNIVEFINQSNFNKVVVYGQSIGSGAASFHSLTGKVDDLILVTPFSSLKDVARSKYLIYPVSILLRDDFDNIQWLENFEGNLFVIHGDNDKVIPNKFSQKLFNEVQVENKKYVLVEGAGHNDIWIFEEFNNNLNDFLEN